MTAPRSRFFAQEETRFAAEGKFPAATAGETSFEVLRARYAGTNFKRAEALCLAGGVDSLEVLKTSIVRGRFAEASTRLRRLLATADPGDRDARLELSLQAARLESCLGRWWNVIEISSGLLAEPELPVLSRMCAFQLRANAAFEAGRFAACRADLERISSLESLFPFGPLAFYARISRAKLDAREVSLAEGRRAETELWRSWLREEPLRTLDGLVALLRLRIDLGRLAGESIAPEARAAFEVARAVGDGLYEALAFLDLYHAMAPESRNALESRLDRYAADYDRIRELRAEIGSVAATTTGRLIQDSLPRADAAVILGAPVTTLIFPGLDARVELAEGRIGRITLQTRARSTLEALAAGPLAKDELLKAGWGIARYSKFRHDDALRKALQRVRAQAGIAIETGSGRVSLPETVLVLPIRG